MALWLGSVAIGKRQAAKKFVPNLEAVIVIVEVPGAGDLRKAHLCIAAGEHIGDVRAADRPLGLVGLVVLIQNCFWSSSWTSRGIVPVIWSSSSPRQIQTGIGPPGSINDSDLRKVVIQGPETGAEAAISEA